MTAPASGGGRDDVPAPWSGDPLLAGAWRLAARAHAGQTRPGAGGTPEPYLRHAERVAAAVAADGHPPHVVAAALLHDAAEDAPEVWAGAAAGLDPRVRGIVDAVTRRPCEDYAAFIGRAGADPWGRVVKLADVRDNRGRLGDLPRDTPRRRARAERLRERYDAALRHLGGAGTGRAADADATAPPARGSLRSVPFTAGVVANCGIAMAMYLYMSTVAGYAIAELGTSESGAGLVSGMFVIGAIAGRIVVGPLATLFGPRRALIASAAFMLLMTLLYPVAGAVGPLAAVRALHGAGFGASATALAGLVLSAVPDGRRGEATGWFTTGLTVATAAGPLLGIRLSVHAGHQPVFWAGIAIAAVTLAAAVVALPAGPPDPPMDRASLARRRARVRVSDGLTRRALPVSLTVAPCAVGFAAVLTYLTPFAAGRGLEGPAGFYFLAYAAVILVSRPAAGVLQDRIGDDAVMIPITAAVTAGLVLTACAGGGAMLLAGGALLGLGYGTQISAGQALAIRRTGGGEAGRAVGSFFILVDGGTGLGPILLGPIAAACGYGAMFLACAVLSIAALIWYVAMVSDRAAGRRTAASG